MSTTKRIIGNYTLTNKETAGANVIISTGTLFIDGNLQIGGNSQSITHTNTDITDNIVVLNKGETSSGVSAPGYAGIAIDRGTLPNVELRWNETIKSWQISDQTGTTFANIANTSNTLSNVSGDSSPSLGGNLFLNNHTIYSGPAKGNVQIFANTANSGGSGVYVTNDATTGAELVTKAKAIAFSIIFG
jgi:hypothetical protein